MSNRREMMEEMLHELSSELERSLPLRSQLLDAATRKMGTKASRARARIVLEAVIRYLRGEGGRTGGF